MAKRRKLSDLIGEETQATETPPSEPTNSVSNEVTNSSSLEVTDLRADEVSNSGSSELSTSQNNEVASSGETPEACADREVPKYLTLVRKEARLREDQLDSLTNLMRSLNRKRKGAGERITENTLIRVAVDLLLNQTDELKGTTEQEIKKSVGLEVAD